MVFSNIGWAEVLVLVFAGLFVLGPERLPSAAAWLGQTVRQVREYATGARDQLEDELGADFDQLRKPLNDLQQLRGLNPKTVLTKHLFDGESPNLFGGGAASAGATAAGAFTKNAASRDKPSTVSASTDKASMDKPSVGTTSGIKPKSANPASAPTPLASGERPPFDADAT